MIDLKTLTIKKAHDAFVKGEYTVRALAEAYLSEIEKKNPELNAYLEVFDDVLAQADAADLRIKNGETDNLLLGIPLAIKDNILIEGRRVGAASKVLEGYVAPWSATAIKKLINKGVVFLGRTNMDEFAMGGSTENSAYGVVKNPHDTERVPGGSSGGSAAVVAADLALAALGSDTGGSIREPAAFCGVVGMKPSYGAVSRHGLIAMASSLDQIGPFAKTVEDARIIFNVLKGKDSYDATTVDLKPRDKKKKKIGVVSKLLETDGIDPLIKKNFNESVEVLKKVGYDVVDVELPHLDYSLAVYYIICPAEVSSNMARFDGMRFGAKKDGSNLLGDYLNTRGELLGAEVKRRIMIGTYVLSSGYYDAFYGKASAVRELIKQDFEKAFEKVDAILTPTTPAPAFKIGEKTENPLEMYLADIFTVAANIASVPAISVPTGKTSSGLPLGMQLIGAYGDDIALFETAKVLES
ncbi:MAG: Asp-tRNA(Asn)/Glu-tRNA(Gln) amidotransferase subunit GatA [Candidatus Paceibacterota bacterium]|jgi:aspartyl-tRNA(Asn)/glutamyl-tRNA(Gln) amidotransferase subunit A